MTKFNRLQTLLILSVPLIIMSLIIKPDTNQVIQVLATEFTLALIAIWYLNILKSIKKEIGISRNSELTIKFWLILIFLISPTSILIPSETLIEHFNIFLLINLTGALLGLVSLYLLALNFGKVLITWNKPDYILSIMIRLAVYPFSIWKYHEIIRKNTKDN